MAAAEKPYPWFFLVNDKPVKFVQLPSGEVDVLAWDHATREFARNLSYISAVFDPSKDVDELDEAAFEKHVAGLRANH
jgi:hypothetical protein